MNSAYGVNLRMRHKPESLTMYVEGGNAPNILPPPLSGPIRLTQ